MGASSSTQQTVSPEQRELESLAASTGALPLLRNFFSKLSDPQTNTISTQSLQQCFYLSHEDPVYESEQKPESFPGLLDHLGSSIVDLFFMSEKGGIGWLGFLRGYVKCCGRMSALMSLNILLRIFAMAMAKVGLSSKLEFESDEADCKINGSLLPSDVLLLLWMCWAMLWDVRTSKSSESKAKLFLPDVSHLVLSAVVSCADVNSSLDVWDCDILGLEIQLPVGKFLSWAVTTGPTVPDCFTQFVLGRLGSSVTAEEGSGSSQSISGDISSKASQTLLLTHGRAWAISLVSRNAVNDEILSACFAGDIDGTNGNLLYRSSAHGKGLNRFWSNVEGYHGPLLILISANSEDGSQDNGKSRKWIIGVLTQQGFENRDTFYGTSGNLYAISPIFHVYSPSGKEENFVYSHLHPTRKVYESHPKPVGIAFGGTISNERMFIDEDFAKITIRHHAVDKTYRPGPLIPNQGFLPVEAPILEVEVWGLGGRTAKEVQIAYKKREELFTEQRRKVDLKTFASWEDSPEKMMMDMMSDPNRVQREDR
ncbi:TLDc [Corchorus capsularis]|uniref:TLDc n=1 Tax=Corchorus capsularis TaxID=210143 RepID=A0A1R3IXZ8_COCAP|nr:TLDc [Corchorus capsularis]